jgi:transcriptional regulator with XRE-family HTH domain
LKLVYSHEVMKERTLKGFGKRLATIRQSKGLTQTQLGEAVGVSKRVITYYEQDDSQPPGAMLVDLARALHVSADQLLGLKPPAKQTTSPRTARLLKRLQRIEQLSPTDRRVILKMVDTLIERHSRANGRA